MAQLKIVEGKAKISIDPKKNYALRIFKNNEQIDYKSTRLGTIENETDGISFDCKEHVGLDYELKALTGKIEVVAKGKLEDKSLDETVKIEKPVKKGKEDGS